jgi:hypothetical protein
MHEHVLEFDNSKAERVLSTYFTVPWSQFSSCNPEGNRSIVRARQLLTFDSHKAEHLQHCAR